MSLKQLRVSLARARAALVAAKARLAYRNRKHRFYHSKSRRPADERRRLASKWHKRVLETRKEVAELEALIRRRNRQIAAKTPGAGARRQIVSRARSHVGVHETFNNGGGMISVWERKLGFGAVPWCGVFAGNMLIAAGVRGVTSRIASVALIEADARSGRGPFRGWSNGTRGAQPGDLACIGRHGQHVEIVESRNADGSVNTVGGNVSNAVRRQRRPAHQVRGIAHIRA